MAETSPDDLTLSLSGDTIDVLQRLEPDAFRGKIAAWLAALGYAKSIATAEQALSRSVTAGIEGVVDQDPCGLDRLWVQATRYMSGTFIGASTVDEAFMAMQRQDGTKGIMVTTARFKPETHESAARLPKPFVLIDGARLASTMAQYGVKLG